MSIFSVGHSTHEPPEFLPLIRGVDVLIDIRSHPTSRWDWWRLENMDWVRQDGHELVWEPRLGGWTKKHYDQYADPMAEVGVDVGAYSKGAFPKQRIGVKIPDGIDPNCPLHGSASQRTAVRVDHVAMIRAAAHQASPAPNATCSCEQDQGQPRWTNRGLRDYSWYMTTEDFHAGLSWLCGNYAGTNQPNAAIMCAEAVWWKCHRSMVADALWFRFGCDTLHLKPSLPKRAATSRFQRHSELIGNRVQRYEPAILDSLSLIPSAEGKQCEP